MTSKGGLLQCLESLAEISIAQGEANREAHDCLRMVGTFAGNPFEWSAMGRMAAVRASSAPAPFEAGQRGDNNGGRAAAG